MMDKKIPKIIVSILSVLILCLAGFFIWQKQTSAPEVTGEDVAEAEHDVFMEQGKDAYLKEDYQIALEFYTKALEIKETESVYVSLYTINKNLGNHDEARTDLLKATEILPGNSRNWIELAEYTRYQFNGDIKEVSAIFEEALIKTTGILKPHVDIRTNYASYLEDMGKYQEAIDNLEIARKLDKTRDDVYQQNIIFLKDKLLGL